VSVRKRLISGYLAGETAATGHEDGSTDYYKLDVRVLI
jgi:hypothetical protein